MGQSNFEMGCCWVFSWSGLAYVTNRFGQILLLIFHLLSLPSLYNSRLSLPLVLHVLPFPATCPAKNNYPTRWSANQGGGATASDPPKPFFSFMLFLFPSLYSFPNLKLLNQHQLIPRSLKHKDCLLLLFLFGFVMLGTGLCVLLSDS